MKKEISPEMYNYNKFPGPSFARVGDKVVSENIELDLVENHKDAFDQTVFGQRFSQLMLKFDYIVGDWGNEQLRLKGFYKDDKPVRSDLKISHLEDYLLEYCNFGCAYFVLANEQPQEMPVEPEDKPRRRRNRNNRKRNNARSADHERVGGAPKENKANNRQAKPKKQENRPRRGKNKHHREEQQGGEAKRSFVIRQK